MDQVRERIRTLNDELRRTLPNCHAVMTVGIAALGPEAIARIIKTIAVYDDFCHANDPYGEHDFGAFEADGAVIFSKRTSSVDHLINGIISPLESSVLHKTNLRPPFPRCTYRSKTPRERLSDAKTLTSS
jgi:hypothetical protein